ncbi:MAG TPA: hypothetical protein VJB87_00735 [Candidatus Nanoarchaeia archaeon]|nr:hypothetical protein [Candidatus Nanoarchaeia archaeon]
MFKVVTDKKLEKQLKKIRDNSLHLLIKKCCSDLESLGPRAGELLNIHVHVYEWKCHRPPLRVYFHVLPNNDILMLHFEYKTSEKKQQVTIDRLRSELI